MIPKSFPSARLAILLGLTVCGLSLILRTPSVPNEAQHTSQSELQDSFPIPRQPDSSTPSHSQIQFSKPEATPSAQLAALVAIDPETAMPLIAEMLPNPAADLAISVHVHSLIERQADEEALEWLSTIANPDLHSDALEQLLAHGYQSGRFSEEDLKALGLAPETLAAIRDASYLD